MAETTGIQWCDRTWSPWEGCQKAGPGCDNCYAEAMNKWLRKGENWGPGAPRRVYSDEHWAKPGRWNAAAEKAGTTYSVFPSVCDPLDPEAPEGQRERFWRVIEATPHLRWLILTKRIGNALRMMPGAWFHRGGWPANARLGATMVNQTEWDRDILKLLSLNVPNFVSIEPQIGAVDLCDTLGMWWNSTMECFESTTSLGFNRNRLDWVIVGGESGRGAREFDIAWPRAIVRQCKAAGVPVFVKQMGARPVWDQPDDGIAEPPYWGRIKYIDKSGGEPTEWPADLRVREFPGAPS